MKPHALRKALWFGNLGLIAGVAAAGWHLLKDVTPATASVIARKPNHIDKGFKKIIDKYDKDRMRQSSWQPKPPVTNQEIQAVFLEKYTKPRREKPHFPFVGPLPPGIAQERKEEVVKKDLPTGLITIGEPSTLLYSPGGHVMLFEFKKSGKSEAFSVGDWIREADDTTERFKLLDIEAEPVRPGQKERSYQVVYGVYEDGKETKRDKLGFNNPRDWGDESDIIRDIKKVAGVGTAEAAEGAAASRDGDGDGGGDEESGEVAKPFTESDIVVVGEVSLSQARPKVLKFGANKRAVVFTEKTRAYFRGKNAQKLAESIKTSVARSGGRVIGLRVTGFGKELNGDTFDVKKGDVLVSINGVPVRDRAGVVELVKRLPKDDLVTVVINRHGKLITYRIDPNDKKNLRNARYFENVDMPTGG